jgi:hypothetical protein
MAVFISTPVKINWKGVALSAVGSMVTAGVGSYGAFNIPNSPTLSAGLNTAAGNIATQGLAIAFHQQEKFNWRSVAAAGVATVVGRESGDLFKDTSYADGLLQQVVTGGATSITSQLITTGKVDWRSVGAGAFEAVAAQKIHDMGLGGVEKAFADGLVGAGAAAIRKQNVLAGAFVGVANSYVSQTNPTGATKYLAQGLIGAGTAAMNRQDMVAGFIGGSVGTMVGDYLPTVMKEVEQTGPLNYRVPAGKTTIDIDGYRGTTMLDAKFVEKPAVSPYIPDSGAPAFLRQKILKEQEWEFERYKAAIDDPAVPFNRLDVLTNEPKAVPYFESLMAQYKVPGTVKVVPTKIPQKNFRIHDE